MARRRVTDAISGREVPATAEEVGATQELIRALQDLGWSPDRIQTRPQWRVPATPSDAAKREQGISFRGFPVDVALFKSQSRDFHDVRAICECKKPDLKSGVEQLKTYLNLEPAAELGIWSNGTAWAIVTRDGRGGYDVFSDVPLPKPDESWDYIRPDRVLRYQDLETPPSLKLLFEDIRDFVAAQDTKVNRDEFILMDLANLLMCKLLDERAKRDAGSDVPMDFQAKADVRATAVHLRRFFERVRGGYPSLFPDQTEELRLDDNSIAYIVHKLQHYRLLGHSRQSVGDAFQVLRGRAVKGQEGQYFTPGPVVRAAVEILNPTSSDTVIDPACGTGGFVAEVLNYVYSELETRLGLEQSGEAKLRWVSGRLYAVDKDAVSVRFAKSYLTLMNNGAHVFQADSLRLSTWEGRPDNIGGQISDGRFSVVLTNPPFGKDLVVSAQDSRREGYTFGRNWRWNESERKWKPTGAWTERQIGLIFLERCLQLLAPDGRLAIVVPETWLFSRNFAWLVDHLTENYTITHVINLPMVAFEEFCRAKTCLLFLKNRRPTTSHEILFSFPETIGFNKHGKPLYKPAPDGTDTDEIDDELTDAVSALKNGWPGKYRMSVPQAVARAKGVLAPGYYWREPYDKAFEDFRQRNDCTSVTLGELFQEGYLEVFDGHGTPSKPTHGKGSIPYVKVSDIKNWRIVENPSFFVTREVAERLWAGPSSGIEPYDLITPSRTSQNIGMWAVVLPWQTVAVLTREFLRLRVRDVPDGRPELRGLDWAFLLYAMSLAVVRNQYRYLVLMQTNREDLSDRWKEVRIPIPRAGLETWAAPTRKYVQSIVGLQEHRQQIFTLHDREELADRPF